MFYVMHYQHNEYTSVYGEPSYSHLISYVLFSKEYCIIDIGSHYKNRIVDPFRTKTRKSNKADDWSINMDRGFAVNLKRKGCQ